MRVSELQLPEAAKSLLVEHGYDELYPPQEEAVRAGVLDGKNLVLASPTASGKTLIAEFAILKHVLEKDGKALYLTPLRALASEKYEEFQKYTRLSKSDGRRLRVAVSSGDYDRADYHLGTYDVIIATNEKADSLLRHKAPWVSELSIVVADEVHLLTEPDRGPTLEVVLTRLTKLNPRMQLLALSATVRNADEIGEWLNAVPITTEWRPVPLLEGVYHGGEIQFKDGSSRAVSTTTPSPILDIAMDVVRAGGQALIFTETRRNAVDMCKRASSVLRRSLPESEQRALSLIAERIQSAGEHTRLGALLADFVRGGAAFHHAGLPGGHRRIVEQAFKNGRIKILSATPTLAAGVNLPARTVIISSYERYEAGYGRYPISVLEYKQFCLPHDTDITLHDGVTAPIEDLVRKRMNRKVLSLSNPHGLEAKPISDYFEREATELIEIGTSIGRTLRATPEHPVFSRKAERPPSWTPIQAISPGDWVAYVREIRAPDRPVYWLDFLPTDTTYVVNRISILDKRILHAKHRALAQKLGVKTKTFQNYISGRRKPPLRLVLALTELLGANKRKISSEIKLVKSKWGKQVRITQLLDEDFMWLVGIVASDGHLREGSTRKRGTYYHLRVFNANPRIVKKTASILRRLGLDPSTRIRQSKHFVVSVGSNLLVRVISQFGIPFRKKSLQLFVPDFVLQFPRRLIGAYLAGVFDGDGSYSETKYPRGKHTMVRTIVIATGSEKFAWGIHELLLRLGIISTVIKDQGGQQVVIDGRQRTFPNPVYRVTIRRIADIQRFRRWIRPAKIRIPPIRYSHYHGLSKYRKAETQGPIAWVKVTRVTRRKLSKPVKVYNLSVDETETYLASNFVVHNCGRAGRPKYDPYGEAVLIAKTEDEQDFLFKSYITAEPERLWSKLGVENILRPHVLATIATGYARTEAGLDDFFARTFYAHQYDPRMIRSKLGDILAFLAKENMISFSAGYLDATEFGRRVSELYIDPMSAVIIRDALYRRAEQVTELSFLHLVARTPDLAPRLYPRRGEEEKLDSFIQEHRGEFMCDVPELYGANLGLSYEEFLAEVKTSLVLMDWINEATEDGVLNAHRVEPGDLARLIDMADWLLHASRELARLFGHKDLLKPLGELRLRVGSGVKRELLPLVRLEGVGRVRARALFNAGLKTVEDLRSIAATDLMAIPTIGPKLAKKIKEQAGGTIKSEEWEALKHGSDSEREQSLLTDYSDS